MPEEIVDEVVTTRNAPSRGLSARRVVDEAIDTEGRPAKSGASGPDDEKHSDTGRAGRVYRDSTLKLFDKLEQSKGRQLSADPDDVIDDEDAGDEGEPGEGDEQPDPDDEGLIDEPAPEGEGDEQPDEAQVAKPPAVPPEVFAERDRLLETNRRLVADLEQARRAPRGSENAERLKALDDAEQLYVDKGPIAAFRHLIGIVLGAAPDSKEVDAELTGAYTDLTAQEVGVPLDPAVQATREAARARLALARDKKERKAESQKQAKQPEQDTGGIPPATIERFGAWLSERQNGTASIADDHPMLMTLSRDFDGIEPTELLARAVKREIEIGSIAADANPLVAIRTVAKKIESHYNNLAEKIVSARKPKTDTTKKPGKPAPVTTEIQTQRQSAGAPTINNASASVAPATPPKPKQQQPVNKEKTRGDFRSNKEWREYLFNKHKL